MGSGERSTQFSSATLYGRKERNLIAVTQNKIVILIIHTDRLERAFPASASFGNCLQTRSCNCPSVLSASASIAARQPVTSAKYDQKRTFSFMWAFDCITENCSLFTTHIQHSDEREVSVLLGVVETVADDEFVEFPKPTVC